ncbi:MAG TPA: fused MFS/spermidine synthase [Thermoanaerobaculia bacterium]
MPPRSRLRILALLFVLTGVTGLLTEQILEKLLGTLLGTSTPAAAVVLAVYFAGLTLGAWSYGLWKRKGIIVYAIGEAGVAICVIAMALAFDSLIPFFVPLLRLGAGHFDLLQALRLLVACCWIIPPTFFMGLTFPAIADVVVEKRAITLFYSLNLLGAVIAAVAGPYLLFPYLGLDRTLIVCGVIDGGVGAIALALRKRFEFAPEEAPLKSAAPHRAATILLITAAGVSGLMSFGLEVLWTHLISVTFGNSIYAFAIMLAVVLLGLLLGGAIATAVSTTRPHLAGLFLLIAAALLAVQYLLWPHVPHQFTVWGGNITTFAGGETLRWSLAIILLLPSTTALGAIYPLLFRIAPRIEGALVGRMAAVNAIGCIAGALIIGFVLIPAIGSEATLMAMVIVYALLGISVYLIGRGRRSLLVAAIGGGAILLLIGTAKPWDRLAITSGEHVYFRPFLRAGTSLLFFHEDTAGGMTTITDTPLPDGVHVRTLLTNGKFQGNDSDERVAQSAFALAPMLHVRRFDRALVVGLGTGQSAQIVRGAAFGRVDVAEIAPGIVAAADAGFRHLNRGVLHDPRVHLHVEDGRNFLLLDDGRYDLITLELTSVWFAGATNLYSREFYALARDRLQPDGIFQQWIQVHHIGAAELASAIITLRSVFPHVSFWYIGGQGILLASKSPQLVQPIAIERARAHSHELLLAPDAVDPMIQLVLSNRLLAPDDVSHLAAAVDVHVNTDRNRAFEYFTPRFNLSRLPLDRINVELLSRFASHPPHRMAPGAPPDVQALVAGADSRRAFSRLR